MSNLSTNFIKKIKKIKNTDSIKKSINTIADIDKDKLLNQKRKIATFQYPLDLETEGDRNIIIFDINIPEGSRFEKEGGNIDRTIKPVVQQNANSLRSKSKLTTKYKRTVTSIGLYMPEDISTTYSTDWQSKELGFVGGLSKALSNFDKLLSTEGAKTILKATGEGITNTIAGVIQQLTPLQVQDARNFGKLQVSNPYMEVLFNGVENRPFNFKFKFTPKNGNEALEIKNIVEQFKYHQAPEFKYAENNLETYFLYPSTFDITFLHEGEENNWLHKISTCSLRNVNIDYNTDGGFRTFEGGAPVSINLSLEFLELEILTKDRIKNGF